MAAPVHILSLATGAGGLDLGVAMAIGSTRTVCYVEIEAYAIELLAEKMESGALDPAPLWTDLRSFDGTPWSGTVDLVLAGYPCQPFSVAGSRAGTDDPRHLWPHVRRIIGECGSPLVFLENVAGHLSLGGHEVVRDLQGMGYRVAAGLFTASEVGAPHRRERLFILAHSERGQLQRWGERDDFHGCGAGPVGHHHHQGWEGRRVLRCEGPNVRAPWPPGPSDAMGWRDYLERWPSLEPSVLRSAHGLAHRVDRLRLCGNGVVPDQAAFAFRELARDLLSSLT